MRTVSLFLDGQTSAVAVPTSPYMSKVTRRRDRARWEGVKVSKQDRFLKGQFSVREDEEAAASPAGQCWV